jgi:DNA polymerase-1
MHDENTYDLYENIEMPLSIVLSSMEKEGICVDSSVLDNQGMQIGKRIEEITKEIYKLAGEEFNIASVSQLGTILFEKLAIAKGKKNKTGYKTDVDTLEKIADKHPIVPLILEYRNLSKLKSTYIDGLISTIHDDHKIHTIFKQTIARTGRLSSIEPNLQNIPVRYELGKQIRKAFIPQNDLFLSCDYSQIELRILAHVTACKAMIDTFKNDGDIHAKVAADINGVDIKDVTKEMRSKAKAVIFGIVYGISGYGLGENLHISKKEADFFINKYYELYPEVRKYMDDTVKLAKETGYVTTLFNRKRVIDEIHNANYMIRQMGERMAINTPIQGTAADIIKLAMIKVYQNINNKNLKSKMILQIHDELIFDVCNEELETLEKIVKDTMENVISLVVPLKVSTDVGKNWYETK